MSNATKRGLIQEVGFDFFRTKFPAINTAQTFYANTLVGLNGGYLDQMDDAAAKIFAGVVSMVDQAVLSGGSNGDILIDASQPRFIWAALNGGGAAVTDVGRLCYAYDNQTVQYVPGANGNVVGRVAYVDSTNTGYVMIEAIYNASQEQGRPLQVASASGAIDVKSGTVMITKAGVAALTLVDPTAGTDDGKELTILSTTAYAHTLAINGGTGNGFNGANTYHTATWANAIGNGITLTAYNGYWYVKNGSNANVTLST